MLAPLNWHPGDRIHAVVRGTTVLIDNRGRVILPAGVRALLGIAADNRIMLLADPNYDLLVQPPGRSPRC